MVQNEINGCVAVSAYYTRIWPDIQCNHQYGSRVVPFILSYFPLGACTIFYFIFVEQQEEK